MTETKLGWWEVNFDLKLEGEDVSFDDLSDNTREHIIRCISEGYTSGEIVEDEETDDDDEYQLTCDGEQKTIEWCEENCPKYHSCDTVAEALDAEKEKEDALCAENN